VCLHLHEGDLREILLRLRLATVDLGPACKRKGDERNDGGTPDHVALPASRCMSARSDEVLMQFSRRIGIGWTSV
jgi:hypothetical protein